MDDEDKQVVNIQYQCDTRYYESLSGIREDCAYVLKIMFVLIQKQNLPSCRSLSQIHTEIKIGLLFLGFGMFHHFSPIYISYPCSKVDFLEVLF